MKSFKDVQTALTNFANAQFQLGYATAQLEAILNPNINKDSASQEQINAPTNYQAESKVQ